MYVEREFSIEKALNTPNPENKSNPKCGGVAKLCQTTICDV